MLASKQKPSPIAARPFTASATAGYPPSLKNSLPKRLPYYSLGDPHLRHFFLKKQQQNQQRPRTAPTKVPAAIKRNDSKSADRLVLYSIAIKTGERKGSGTRAPVFITLQGSKAKLGKRRVVTERSSNDGGLDSGSLYRFSMKGKDIGELKHIVVENSALSKEGAWFLDSITVTKRSTGQRWGCICNQWLSLFHTDCQTTRQLLAKTLTGAQPLLDATDYVIEVHTADVKGAGTDANVFLTLSGTRGLSPKSSLGNRFPRGSVEKTTIKCSELGRLMSLKLDHDDTGFSPSWLVDKIIVTSGKQEVVFHCGQWLSSEVGDRKVERTLVHQEESVIPIPHQQCRYIVTTHTGRQQGSGTDSQVYLKLCGACGDSREHLLDNNVDNFQRGRVDRFLVECISVGKLNGLCFRLVKSGLSPNWFLDHVEVQEWGSEDKTPFLCQQWLHPNNQEQFSVQQEISLHSNSIQDSSMTFTEGHPLTMTSNADDCCEKVAQHLVEDNRWLLKVVTSDTRGAGTDARVFIQVHSTTTKSGEKDNICTMSGENTSDLIWLEDKPEYFEQGQENEFNIILPKETGNTLTGLTVGHDNCKPYPEWHLGHIDLISNSCGVHYRFVCQKWLKATESNEKQAQYVKCRLSPEIVRKWVPERCNVEKDEEFSSTTENSRSVDSRVKGIPYSIHVTLSEQPLPGSKGHLVIKLMGSIRTSPPLHLLPLSKPNLIPSRTELYSVHTADVGSINSINIWLDSNEEGEQWCIQEVAVHVPGSTTGYHFCASGSQWVKGGRITTFQLMAPTPSSTLSSQRVTSSPSSPNTTLTAYEVRFLTADKKSAGTKNSVHLMLKGSDGCSKVFKFHNSHGRHFQRGQTDTFQIAISENDIGHISSVAVTHTESSTDMSASPWYLYQVILVRLHDKNWFHFTCQKWLQVCKNCDSRGKPLQFTEIPISKSGTKH